MKFFLIFSSLFFFQNLIAQNTSDADRLKQMSYMEIGLAKKINCDSTSGTNLEHRICLNFEFQEVDSILNNRFYSFLKTIETDSIKMEIINFQNRWIENRRLQSRIVSEGFRGHMLGIYYLACMVKMTKLRIEELEYFIGEK